MVDRTPNEPKQLEKPQEDNTTTTQLEQSTPAQAEVNPRDIDQSKHNMPIDPVLEDQQELLEKNLKSL